MVSADGQGMRKNVVVVLLGYPGSGKLTIARLLAPRIGALVVDNHWVNNPIFGLIATDGMTPLPAAVWAQVDKVQEAVMETIATLAPPDGSFILTYCAFEGDSGDRKSYELMRMTAERREALFVPVRTLCSEEEVARRTVSPGRKEQLKSIDPVDGARLVRTRAVLDPRHQNQMTLDVSALSAEQSAVAIERHIHAVAGGLERQSFARST
jgi:hypothetical protein